jgi:hypothetical protein
MTNNTPRPYCFLVEANGTARSGNPIISNSDSFLGVFGIEEDGWTEGDYEGSLEELEEYARE